MVFVNTAARAEAAAAALNLLRDGGGDAGWGEALAVHRDVAAAERAARLERFRAGGGAVCVCTDLAARGLDIAGGVDHVIQLDFAANAVAHLHRVGRTARAGAAGVATHIVGPAGREVAAAIQGEAGAGRAIAPVFSRNRGFRRRMKRHGTGLATIVP